MKTFFIVNPFSRCGATRPLWHKVERQVRGWGWEYDWAFTEGPYHASSLATAALERGYQMVVPVGGDGTFHEVINGLFRQGKPVQEQALLGLLPSGTGTDFAKTMKIPRSLEAAARRLFAGVPHPVDLGIMSYQDLQERPAQRIFGNVADGGLGAKTVEWVDSRPKRGGSATFLAGAIRSLARYRKLPIQVTIDDQIERTLMAVIVVIANGRFFGGGMRIAPLAEPDDGLFDIVLIKDLSAFKILRNLYRIYTGSHIELPEVEVLRGKKVRLQSEEDFLLEADGELLGKAPAEFQLYPHAIQVKC